MRNALDTSAFILGMTRKLGFYKENEQLEVFILKKKNMGFSYWL